MSGQMKGTFDTSNIGLLHDIQLDYYGRRAAAASEDGMVYVYDVADGQQQPMGQAKATLKGHEGPVWKVSWAHPKFGPIIASCGYDMRIIVWKETQPLQWQIAFMDTTHSASVNDAQFAPWEHGLRLACASSDGMVSVLTHSSHDQQWRRTVFTAHAAGAQALSWAPVQQRDGTPSAMRLATGGCDHAMCIWKCEGEAWVQETPALPAAHTDWVRAVAWRPDAAGVLASGSWDKSVVIWAQEMEGQPWRQVSRLDLGDKVEDLSWSVTGSILAVSFGDSETALYKEAPDGHYEKVGKVSEPGFMEVANSLMNNPPVATGFGATEAAGVGTPQQQTVNPELAMQQQSVMDSFGI